MLHDSDNVCLCACVTQTPFARDSFLKDEVVDKLNEALTYVSPPSYEKALILHLHAPYYLVLDQQDSCGCHPADS